MTLIEFLLARIAEDEAAARGAGGDGWRPENSGYEEFDWIVGPSREEGPGVYRYVVTDQPQADHIARWDPARVLAECDTRRRIVARYRVTEPNYDEGNRLETRVLNWTMRLLALPYADHADWRAEWRP